MALTLDEVRSDSMRYGAIAHIATVSASGTPYTSPVAVAWHGDEILTFVLSTEAKVKNLRSNPKVSVHFAVGDSTDWDSCVVWGSGFIIDDTQGRKTLWDKMGYPLERFEPGGPEADTHVFIRVVPTRAVILRNYGLKGRDTWRASAT